MRVPVGITLVILSLAAPAAAQEWTEYKSMQDRFSVLFPGEPRVTETGWTSEMRFKLPARVYSVEKGRERYSVTVVDYRDIEKQGVAHLKTCAPGATSCFGSDLSGPGYWKHDVRGALIYATRKYLESDSKLTEYLWNHQNLVEGHELHLTNPDKSRTNVFIGMHEMKLYIVEGTVPDGYPEPGLFQSSLGWLDENGNGIRYQAIYANQFHGLKLVPPPGRAGGGRGGGGGGAAGGGGGRGGAQ
jgi:hypothetical protein